MNYRIDRIPDGYHLYAYDDCGVEGRQPHVDMRDCYNFTFSTDDNDAEPKARSAVFSAKEVRLNYDDLDSSRSYILALTYATDQVYKRVQSLEANGVELHGPLPLPKGKSIKVLVTVPPTAIQGNTLHLQLKIHGEVNVTASIVELWATGEPRRVLRLSGVTGAPAGLTGRVQDIAWEGTRDAEVRLARAADHHVLATTATQPNGSFLFPTNLFANAKPREDLEIMVGQGTLEAHQVVPVAEQSFEPVRYRPLPAQVTGLKEPSVSLDGVWRINPEPGPEINNQPLDAAGWRNFTVPGEFALQGYVIPEDKTVALAREFTVPAEWTGYRIFLRFDAIHAGTIYTFNGQPLGKSENLFTPVEWEITDFAKPGQTNRLDLAMVMATASERLSHSSAYAYHNLGGIDRAVRIYALPKVQLANLHVNAGLDAAYRDGELALDLGLDNPEATAQTGLSVSLTLLDAEGKPVEHSTPKQALEPLQPGRSSLSLASHVPAPRKWNAEQPNLYKLVLTLEKDGQPLERIERNVGFRKIELKDRQFYVNGARVKLAGVCHHEIDPLTGRADTMRHAEQDVKFFKQANLNFVRTSHYPCTQEFLDAADRYGLYVESEAPFCWVAPAEDLTDLHEILTPTSAMIDYNHSHPSVIMWSVANESNWSELFDISNKLCKSLDPTRPTTIEWPTSRWEEENCDIINRHYPSMPFDDVGHEDPRPFLVGECFFLVYHERTDVTIDPGLREIWAHGSADPNSAWGKFCAESFARPGMHAGIHPGAWNHIYASQRCIGSEIWSGIDDITILPDGKASSCENGNAIWGLIDGWRRPKPELWLSKALFSPVWFPARQVDWPTTGQTTVRIPVENRYSFTDLGELAFTWELAEKKGMVHVSAPPAGKGTIEIPLPPGTSPGSELTLRVANAIGEPITGATITLGQKPPQPLPQPQAGSPVWHDDGRYIVVEGQGFSLALDRTTGDLATTHPAQSDAQNSPLLHLPALHVTRHDYGDLNPPAPPYVVFPDPATRVVESVTATTTSTGLELTIKDHFAHFAGSLQWLLDKNGAGRLRYDYAYTGDDLETREIGLRTLLRPACDDLSWHRWSEWGDVFPAESISRTTGRARAHRGSPLSPQDPNWPNTPKLPATPANVKPDWPWAQDETELGTADFRAIRFNIYDAQLTDLNGAGLAVQAHADAHVRACLAPDGVALHLLTQCPLAPPTLKSGDHLTGEFAVQLLSAEFTTQRPSR